MKKLQDMTDEELALSYIDGNNRAFDLLLLRNQSNIYSYILFIVHDRETAEDLFQDTFVKAIACRTGATPRRASLRDGSCALRTTP